MNLSQLKYARAVAETLSFSRASEQCFVTQPTLSNAISQLETELGGSVFFRTTHRVGITPFGERVLPFVIAVLDAQSDLERTAKKLVEHEQKMIRVGFCPLVNTQLLMSILEPFRRANGPVEIVLKEGLIDDLEKRLSENKIDVLFVPRGIKVRHAERCEFYSEPLYFLSRESQIELPKIVTVTEVADEVFTTAGEGCGLVFTLRDIFQSRGVEFKEYAGQALSYSVLEDWTSLGIGSTILPRSKISEGNKNARPLFIEGGVPATIIFDTVWNKRHSRGSQVKSFLRYFKRNAPEFVKGLSIARGG